MSGRFFLDTNIFVYAFDPGDERKNRIALALIETAVQSQRGVVSYQVVQEFLNVAIRKFDPAFTLGEAQAYLSSVLRPMLRIQSSFALFSEAIDLYFRYHSSWYDSLILAGAIQADCSIVYSEDMQHGLKIGTLRVENPFR